MSYRKIHDSFEDKDRMPSALTVVSVIVCILCIGYATGSFSLMTPLISAGLFFLLGLWTFIKIYTAHRLDSRMERVYPDH